MTRVLVVAHNAQDYVDRLRPRFHEVELVPAAMPEDAEPHLGDAEVLMAIGHWLTPEHVARAPRLRWAQSLITGVERFLVALDGRPDVLLTSTRGIHGPQMSETVLTHMLAITRQLPRMVRNQARHAWEPFDQPMLQGKTVAIVGIGVAGEATARLCKAFGMTVHGVSRTARPVAAIDRFFDRSQLTEAAATADYLVLTVPHTADTERLVDADVLVAMKPDAYLVNVARGAIVDEPALIEALRAGRIAGAGLDVFAARELAPDSPLWDLPNVLVTPHVAGRSDRYVDQALTIVEPNLRRYLAGERERMLNVIER